MAERAVIVIGGGMAAVVAAVTARRRGANVTVVRKALGATAMSSGAVDVAVPHLRADGTLEDSVALCVRELARRPEHPFSVLRAQTERLGESLRLAAELTGGLIASATDRLRYFPTVHGNFKPAVTAQASQVHGALGALPAVTGVVGFRGAPLLDASFVARGLSEDARALGQGTRFIPVESRVFNQLDDALRQPFELAARFDVAGPAAALAEELGRVDAAAFLLPPVLGLRSDAAAELSNALKRPCAELLAEAHGSVPGLRLQRALDEALKREGVRVVDATARVSDGALYAENERLPNAAVVLATGKFIGGGIRRDGVITETVYGAPVYVNERRGPAAVISELLGERYGDDQAVFRAGVRVDSELRPLDAAGRPLSQALFAAGSVISGFDPAVDGGGLGLSIFTGMLAGERAAAA